MTTKLKTWDYNGVEIAFVEEHKRFLATWNEDETQWYDSFDEAKKAIDAKAEAQAKTNRVRISVPVVQVTGEGEVERRTITGIHASRNVLLTTPREHNDILFVDHPAVLDLLRRRTEAALRVRELNKALEPFRIMDALWLRVARQSTPEEILAWEKAARAKADELLRSQAEITQGRED